MKSIEYLEEKLYEIETIFNYEKKKSLSRFNAVSRFFAAVRIVVSVI